MKGGSESTMISGQGFKNLCKYNLDDRYSLKPIDSSLQEGDSVFLKFGDIPAFLASPPSKKVVLVVGNMDETFDDGQMVTVSPYVTKVYSVNSSAKGAIQLPLGFRDDQYTSHKVMTDILNDNSKPGTKEILCLVNFLIDTNGSERSKARDRFNGESWATISDEYMNYNKGKSLNHSGDETKQIRADYYAMLKRTKCVVCPPGTGVDTHRVYETLYFGAIPIIKSSFLDPMYERVGGCWIVNDWSEVTEEECNRRWSNRASVNISFEASAWFPGTMTGGSKKSKAFVYTHLGLGDMICMIGAVRYLATLYDEVHVACKNKNKEAMQDIYGDNPKIKLIGVNGDDDLAPWSEKSKKYEKDGYDVYSCGLFASKPNTGSHDFPNSFYDDMGISRENRKSHFHIPRTESAKQLYESFQGRPYIVVHQNASTHTIPIVDKLRSQGEKRLIIDLNTNQVDSSTDPEGHALAAKAIFRPFTDYVNLFEGAEEVHLIDSSICCLAIHLNVDKVKKRIIYARPGNKDTIDSFGKFEYATI